MPLVGAPILTAPPSTIRPTYGSIPPYRASATGLLQSCTCFASLIFNTTILHMFIMSCTKVHYHQTEENAVQMDDCSCQILNCETYFD
eukprot:174300-Pleurochrysis_carterae.AAC.1